MTNSEKKEKYDIVDNMLSISKNNKSKENENKSTPIIVDFISLIIGLVGLILNFLRKIPSSIIKFFWKLPGKIFDYVFEIILTRVEKVKRKVQNKMEHDEKVKKEKEEYQVYYRKNGEDFTKWNKEKGKFEDKKTLKNRYNTKQEWEKLFCEIEGRLAKYNNIDKDCIFLDPDDRCVIGLRLFVIFGDLENIYECNKNTDNWEGLKKMESKAKKLSKRYGKICDLSDSNMGKEE